MGGSHLKTYRGTAPYILADYILFIDSSNSLVACSVHGTNLPSENQYDGFWESCGVEPQAKDFKSFLCKIAVSVRRRLHRNATTGRSPCTPVFPGRQRSFPPSREKGVYNDVYAMPLTTRLAEGVGLEPTHRFRLLAP